MQRELLIHKGGTMGLDMYLNKKTYVGNNWKKKEEQAPVTIPHVKQERVTYITEQVGYWRKANAIHQWFVDNVQEGEDDCKEYYVTREKLEALLNTVREVLQGSTLVGGKIQNGTTFEDGKVIPVMEDGKYIQDSTLAEKLLPTSNGYFFGGTGYDEYYYHDLVETEKILQEVLQETPESDF